MGQLTKMVCDRCKQKFQGYMVEGFTAGFYLRGPAPGNWDRWMSSEEKVVCDVCMQSDPRYIAVYGPLSKKEED